MKKNFLTVAAMGMAAAFLCFIPSCKGSDKASANDSEISIEEVSEDAQQPLLLTDSLATVYNKAFFDDASKESSTPSDSTWVKTSSGLKYVVVKEGDGAQPKASDSVTVHYIGRLTNGTVFDSSTQPRQEGGFIEKATFPLSGVIAGWTEGLQYMKEGGVSVFYIPSDIAYGKNGGGPIPPDSDLIFDIQLYNVNDPTQAM